MVQGASLSLEKPTAVENYTDLSFYTTIHSTFLGIGNATGLAAAQRGAL